MDVYFLYLISSFVLAASGTILQKYGKIFAFELGLILSRAVPGRNMENGSEHGKGEEKLRHFAERFMKKEQHIFSSTYTKIYLILMLIADFRSDEKAIFSFAVALLVVLSMISSEVSLFDFAFLFCGFGALVFSASEVALYAISQTGPADILFVSFAVVFLYCYIPYYEQKAKHIFFHDRKKLSWKSAGNALADVIPVIASVAAIMDSETVRKVFLS